MFFRRVGVGLGVVAVGIAAAVLPVVPGVAGAHPAYCSLNKTATNAETKAEGTIVKAIESGNWKAAQKALIASIGKESSAEKEAVAALSGVPANVKSAGETIIAYSNTAVKIIKSSTSVSQFEASEQAAAESPKVLAAEKVLSTYFDGKCGISPSTTPTT